MRLTKRRILSLFLALCMLIAVGTAIPTGAYTGTGLNLIISSADLKSTGIPNGINGLVLPLSGTVGSPYTYGVISGQFGKQKTDESFWYSSEWGSSTFIDAGGVTAVNMPGAALDIPMTLAGLDNDIVHMTFEIAREGFAAGGFVECRPRHAGYTSGTMPYFAQGQMLNNTSGLKIFGQTVDTAGLPMNNWNRFDYIFYTKYTPSGSSEIYTAADVYYNGVLVMNKLVMDADKNTAGNQLMTGLMQLRFSYSLVKSGDRYPRATSFIDNVKCNVVAQAPVVPQITLSHAGLTINNQRRQIQNTDENLIVSGLIGGLPSTYLYEVVDHTGQILTPNDYVAVGQLRVKDAGTGEILAFYRIEQPDFAEATPVSNLTFSASDVNATTGVPNGMFALSLPLNGTVDSPYSYGVAPAKFGKQAADENLWYKSKWDSATFKDAGGVTAANLQYASFNLSPNIKGLDDGIIHASFELAREGFGAGGYIECRPEHKDYVSGTLPYFKQSHMLNNTGISTLKAFGQTIDTAGLPMENWNKFDYIFFTKYTPEGSSEIYTAVDVYYNGIKVLDKLQLDADQNLTGNQLMTGLVQARVSYSPTKSGTSYPEATAFIDNIKVVSLKRAPKIEPLKLAHWQVAINNQRRTLTDSSAGLRVSDMSTLSSSYSYEFVNKSSQVLGATDFIAPGYMRVKNSSTGDILAVYKIEATVNTTLNSEVYTILKNCINGYENMTVQDIKNAAIINPRSRLEVYNANGTVADNAAPAAKGMYLRVTASDNTTYADYILNYPLHQVGEISYTVDGLNADGTYTNGKVNANVIVDSYVGGITKNYTLMVAQYENSTKQLSNIKTATATVNTKGTTTISLTYDIQNTPNTSIKLFLWDDYNSLEPLKKAYLLDTHLAGKTLLNFGDSITGMGMRSYSENLQKNTGMQTINLGVGGAKMANIASQPISAFSMAEIVTGLTTPGYNWSAQDSYAVSQASEPINVHFANMKALNISTIDYITVFYGTNDFTSNVPLDNPTNNSLETTTFGGAIRYSIDRLLAANPNMKIMLITPMYRDRQAKTSDNPYIADGKNSDDYPNGSGIFLQQYGDKIKQVAAEYPQNVVVLDMYQESGIHKYNHERYFYDGLHPYSTTDSVGNILLGSKISDALIRNF